jgi:hypothetical protein
MKPGVRPVALLGTLALSDANTGCILLDSRPYRPKLAPISFQKIGALTRVNFGAEKAAVDIELPENRESATCREVNFADCGRKVDGDVHPLVRPGHRRRK